jgi:hypothetical protein
MNCINLAYRPTKKELRKSLGQIIRISNHSSQYTYLQPFHFAFFTCQQAFDIGAVAIDDQNGDGGGEYRNQQSLLDEKHKNRGYAD